ncbi:MAG: D-alanyl-D-alanine carboxypeptidase [Ruminococcaceae bacterium]|nr:D-alanyl-D-alanine carboxypeptidase [Oscillospiraceae bacterium]
MKRILGLIIVCSIFALATLNVLAVSDTKYVAETVVKTDNVLEVNANSAVLMEADTGAVLLSQNQDDKAPLASVTKIMTLILVMEAIEDGKISTSDKIVVSDFAASMGGSQVFLEEGEEMLVEELIKCTVIASANDAAVALAERIGGSEKLFVQMMNSKAKELGMKNTNFENVTGLDDTATNHYSSAFDIAIMSRELIKYDLIKKYSSLWQDTIRNGEFTLTNTNRLVRYYDGCNGLKTGSTDKAGFCISATAERDGMQLIAVIMGAETRDIRNAEARSMLDFGFSNYAVYHNGEQALENIPINKGIKNFTTVYSGEFSCIIPKSKLKDVELVFEIPDKITAPMFKNDKVGKINYKLGETLLGTSDIFVAEDIPKITYLDMLLKIIKCIFVG